MKKIVASLAILFAVLGMNAQTTEFTQEVNSPVQSAIIYLYGAEVNHSKQVALNQGRNKIVFIGLSPKIVSKSIQVNVGNSVSILSISDAVNYMANQKESQKIKQLKDSLQLLSEAVALTNYDIDAYSTEKNMLLKNQEIGGTDKGVAVAELKLASDFYRTKIKEINTELYKLEKKTKLLNENISKINQQLNELNAKSNQPTSEITILLYSPTKVSATIDLKYIVMDAGWAPSYDLKAEDINQPIELKYRAKVFNNTGVDWNDIKIKLSTADPSQSAAKPILETWNLDYVMNNTAYKKYNEYSNNAPAMQLNEGYMQNAISGELEMQKPKQKMQQQIKQPIEFEEIQVSELSAEFDIKTNYTVPSDAKPYIVDVTEYKLPATYKHYCVAKLDRDAFLLARITGWEDLNLVEGPANVYFSGTYVGQSYVYTRSTDDTLDLSLGRDNKVLVTRSKIKEYSSKKLLGNTTKETFAYEMVIKNNRKTAVQIDLEDQLPISTKSDITVEPLEISKGELDAKTGKLTWAQTVQPGEVKKITLSFSIKYPRNATINSQNMKRKYRAKF
ncbi:MAG: mucoidy inhibitor MuiA family protein [Bacteroidetes bacterium]|nr:mucoidy inhibitor MuiA family protein [Bacteroidota bacterium]